MSCRIQTPQPVILSLDPVALPKSFLDMDVEEPGFDASIFGKNRGRFMEHEVAGKFFAEVVALGCLGVLIFWRVHARHIRL